MSNLECAINSFINIDKVRNLEEVQTFLNQYSPKVQQQFVSALYHGRTHIHQNKFSEDEHPAKYGILNANHISANEYARLISEKGQNVATYLNKFKECARNSEFEINSL